MLDSHPYRYQLSQDDAKSSLWTLGSGWVYAKRHLELVGVGSNPLVHRVLATIECIPVIGGATALAERCLYALVGSDRSTWRETRLDPSIALEKMIKNQKKAISEHYKAAPLFGSPYVSNSSLSAEDLVKKEVGELELKHHFFEAQGPRPSMEDAHFYQEMHSGVLTGVFDGHGGSKVSAYASDQFQKSFSSTLRKADGNVHEAFEKTIHRIHQKVANTASWNRIGSTAVVCYIDKQTHQIFTATLGDSEANIYRKTFLGSMASIPLSCVRDWLSEKDLARLRAIYGAKSIERFLRRVGHEAKAVRSYLAHGVNVARAIGDVDNRGEPGAPRVIHKPKITVNQLCAGDTLILACDGLKDFVSERKIAAIVGGKDRNILSKILQFFWSLFGKRTEERPLAERLGAAALSAMNDQSNDNVTITVIEV